MAKVKTALSGKRKKLEIRGLPESGEDVSQTVMMTRISTGMNVGHQQLIVVG